MDNNEKSDINTETIIRPIEKPIKRFEITSQDGIKKSELIELFIDYIRKDGRVLGYISEENIRAILETAIDKIEFGDIKNNVGEYSDVEKKIIFNSRSRIGLKTIIHELFHALTTDQKNSKVSKSGVHFIYNEKKWYEGYEIGRGLNEGITSYLTHHVLRRRDNSSDLKFYIFSGEPYVFEQMIVEELVVLYGEDAVLGSYFEASPHRIIQAIGESGAIKKPKETLNRIMYMLDFLENIEKFGDIIDLDYKTCEKEFVRIQKKVIKELIEKEISFALKTKDDGAITRVKQKLENLQRLGITIDGKNVFEKVIQDFNNKLKRIPDAEKYNIEIDVKGMSLMLNNVSQGRGSMRVEILRSVSLVLSAIQKNRLTKYDKNVLDFIEAPREDIEVQLTSSNSKIENAKEEEREALLTQIRGNAKEGYEKVCQESEQNFISQRKKYRKMRNNEMNRA